MGLLVFFLTALSPSVANAGTYAVKSGDNPAAIAKKTGISVNDLMKANPGLDPRKLKVGQKLAIPDGKDEAKKSAPEKSSKDASQASPPAANGSYVVRPGDTPGGIAAKNGVSTKELLDANPSLDPRKMKVGQKLAIPGKAGRQDDAEAAAAKKSVMEKAEKIAAEKPAPIQAEAPSKTYKVKKGDSLGKIAAKHRISLSALRKANKNLDPKKLRVGQTLNIPGAGRTEEALAPAEPSPAKTAEDVVQTETPAPAEVSPSESPAPAEEQAQSKTPMDADAFFERGNELGKQNKFQQAIESFDKAIKINPDRADYYASRGHAFYYMKLYSRAIEDYSKAIKRNDKFALAYSMRGLSRTRNNQYEQAVSDYDKAIELGPKEADYYKGRGWTYFHLKKYEPMCADYKKACDLGDCEFLEVAKKSNLCAAGN